MVLGIKNINNGHYELAISYFYRPATNGKFIVYLHGLGCSKHDFLGAAMAPQLWQYGLLAFDFPGSGESPYPSDKALSLDDLVKIARSLIESVQSKNFALVGHSMGGVVGTLFCEQYAKLVTHFINIEGNLGSRDCFWSRKATQHLFKDFEHTFSILIKKLASLNSVGARKYAKQLAHTSLRAFYDYSHSLVDYSDSQKLLERFAQLTQPTLYVYGSENSDSLAYLDELKRYRSQLAEIPLSNHFPQYDNPRAFYSQVHEFISK